MLFCDARSNKAHFRRGYKYVLILIAWFGDIDEFIFSDIELASTSLKYQMTFISITEF